MNKAINMFSKISLVVATAILVGISSTNVLLADDATCDVTNTTGSGPYGSIIDPCQTSIVEGDILFIAVGSFVMAIVLFGIARFIESNPVVEIS